MRKPRSGLVPHKNVLFRVYTPGEIANQFVADAQRILERDGPRGFLRPVTPAVAMQEINHLAALAVIDPAQLIRTTLCMDVANWYHPQRLLCAGQDGELASPADLIRQKAENLRRHAWMVLSSYTRQGRPATWLTPRIVASHTLPGAATCWNFRPGFACYIYLVYGRPGGVVLDTSMGYGGRLVGYIASGLRFLDHVRLYNVPVEEWDVGEWRGRADLAFTSPPYFSAEHYSDEPTQSYRRYTTFDRWVDGFLRPMIRRQWDALRPGGYNVLVVNDLKLRDRFYPILQATLDVAAETGFVLEDRLEYPMAAPVLPNIRRVPTDPCLVFRKPGGPSES